MSSSLPSFDLEVFFSKHEFSAQFLLGCSDAESVSMAEILAMADEECLQIWDNLGLGYTESRGLPLLNQEVY